MHTVHEEETHQEDNNLLENANEEHTVCFMEESRNTASFDNEDSDLECSTETQQTSKMKSLGNRITNPIHYYDELKKVNDEHGFRKQCSFYDIFIEKHRDFGLCTKLKFRCNICKYYKWVNLTDNDPKAMPLNKSAVLGSTAAGTGYSELKQQLAAMAIPCMTDVSYRKHRQELVSSFEKASEESMKEAAAIEKELAIMEGDTIDGIPFITVIVDGSWLKRSYKSGKYDSLSGCGAIIGYRTKKVLYVGVRNKFCWICSEAERQNGIAKQHECFKNWGRDQSSSGMEKDIIVQGFTESVEKHGLIYKTVVGDGDSSVYKAVLDSNPYRKYRVKVEKVECTNHLLRNMCNKIVDVSRGRMVHSLARGNVKSFRDIVKRSFKIRQHIVMLIKIRKNDPSNSEDMKHLQRQILNSVHHVFGDHCNCKKYKVPCEEKETKNWIPTLKSTGMYNSIHRAVSDLSCHVRSLLLTTTNNYVESFNAIVAKMVG